MKVNLVKYINILVIAMMLSSLVQNMPAAAKASGIQPNPQNTNLQSDPRYPLDCADLLPDYVATFTRDVNLHSPASSLLVQPGDTIRLTMGPDLTNLDAVMVYIYAPGGDRRQFCTYYPIDTPDDYYFVSASFESSSSAVPFNDRAYSLPFANYQRVLIKIPASFPSNSMLWFAPVKNILVAKDEAALVGPGKYAVRMPGSSETARFCIRSQGISPSPSFELRIRQEENGIAAYGGLTLHYNYLELHTLSPGMTAAPSWVCGDFTVPDGADGITIEVNYPNLPQDLFDYCATTAAQGGCPDSTPLSISGKVTLPDGTTGIPNVVVFSDTGIATSTDGNGNYTLTGLDMGSVGITPSSAGWSFIPSSRPVYLPPDQTGINFTGTQNCYKLVRSHTGQGTDPTAAPAQSAGCAAVDYYHSGENITFTPNPAVNWELDTWSGTDNGSNVLVMPAIHNYGVAANYTENCYRLLPRHTGEGDDPMMSPVISPGCPAGRIGFYHAGQVVTVTANPAQGSRVASWINTDIIPGAGLLVNTVTMAAANKVVTVNYDGCLALTLTHTGSGEDPLAQPHNGIDCPTNSYPAGMLINLTALPDLGADVQSWNGTADDSSTEKYNNLTMPFTEHTVNVNYGLACYPLQLIHDPLAGGSDPIAAPANSTNCPSGEYNLNEEITLTAAPTTGWQLVNWSGTNNDNSTGLTNTVTMPAAEHTASANYSHTCYLLSVSHTGPGVNPVVTPSYSVGCASGQYTSGETITLDATNGPAAGYWIGGWNGTLEDLDTPIPAITHVNMPAANHNVVVNYVNLPPNACYSLTLTHIGSGTDPEPSPAQSANCPTHQYHSGEVIALSNAIPDNGWHIIGWSGTENDASTSPDNTVHMPPSNYTVAVYYSKSCFVLTLGHTPLAGGGDPVAAPVQSTGCPTHQYVIDETITLTSSPADGSTVQSWTGTDNDASTAITNTLTMPGNNHEVTVNYTQLCYTLTLAQNPESGAGGGLPTAVPTNSAGCPAGKYVAQEAINLVPHPADGWEVNYWTVDTYLPISEDSPTIIMPTSSITATVFYTAECYALTLQHDPTEGGADPTAAPVNSEGCPSGSYHYLEPITLTTAPNTGWEVINWSGTDDDNSSSLTNTLTMPAGDHAASVQYAIGCYTLILNHDPFQGGSDPTAAPDRSVGCPVTNTYHYQEQITLTALPAMSWDISSWLITPPGTTYPGSSTYSLDMPAANLTATVNYGQACYLLTVSHTGQGDNPTAAPNQSIGCAQSYYHAQELVALSASPAPGWKVNGWSGTDNNASTNTINYLTMPAQTHSLSVTYANNKIFLPLIAINPLSTISGRIVNSTGSPLNGVIVSASGGNSTVTGSDGSYILSGLPAGTYTISPSSSGYTFSPSSRTVTLPPTAVEQNFTASAVDYAELIQNGNFETDSSWYIPATEYTAGYSTTQAHQGLRSMRCGITDPAANKYSYSSARQTINIPGSVTSAILDFWIYPQSTETGLLALPANLMHVTPNEVHSTNDYQFVMLLDQYGNILQTLVAQRTNDRAWIHFNFDLTQYAGDTVQVYFAAYNDGWGGVTAMYIDDVSLKVYPHQ
jgi:hypothetical protein